jgi:hypothetical protein
VLGTAAHSSAVVPPAAALAACCLLHAHRDVARRLACSGLREVCCRCCCRVLRGAIKTVAESVGSRQAGRECLARLQPPWTRVASTSRGALRCQQPHGGAHSHMDPHMRYSSARATSQCHAPTSCSSSP